MREMARPISTGCLDRLTSGATRASSPRAVDGRPTTRATSAMPSVTYWPARASDRSRYGWSTGHQAECGLDSAPGDLVAADYTLRVDLQEYLYAVAGPGGD